MGRKKLGLGKSATSVLADRDKKKQRQLRRNAAQQKRRTTAMMKAEVDRRAHCESREAFAMGHLERLGAGSRVRGLDAGVVQMVLELV